MVDITKLSNDGKLEALESLKCEEVFDEEVIRSVIGIEDNLTKLKATMLLEDKARTIGKVSNFKKLLGALKAEKTKLYNNSDSFVAIIDGVDMVLQSGPWIVDDNGVRRFVMRNNMEVEETACWQPVIITNIYQNKEMMTYRVQLAFKEHAGARTKTITVNKSTIANTSNIVGLADYGISITNATAAAMVAYLNDLERLNVDTIPRSEAISRVGWVDDGTFVPYQSDICFDGETMYSDLYNAIKSVGNYDDWKQMVLEETSIPAKIVLGASFASPLVGLLNTLPFFTHFWGNTGNGKSVALNYAQSVWGNPMKLVQNLNGTVVALERLAGFFCNLPLTLDELQTIKKATTGRESSFDEILYKLGQGRGKARGRKDGTIERTQNWALSIITTGEEPITNSSSQEGAKNRVLDIFCKDNLFTNATKVIKTSMYNYGHAGKDFIEKLISYVGRHSTKPLSDLYDKFFAYLLTSQPTDKQAMSATMVTLGHTLMHHFVFGVEWDKAVEMGMRFIDCIRPMLVKVTEINNTDNFYMDLITYVMQNLHHFIHMRDGESGEYNPNDNRLETKGKIKDDFIYITCNDFNKFCALRNVSERKIVKQLGLQGKILTIEGSGSDATYHSRPIKINNVAIRCVAVRLPNYDEKKKLEDMGVELIPMEDGYDPFA